MFQPWREKITKLNYIKSQESRDGNSNNEVNCAKNTTQFHVYRPHEIQIDQMKLHLIHKNWAIVVFRENDIFVSRYQTPQHKVFDRGWRLTMHMHCLCG